MEETQTDFQEIPWQQPEKQVISKETRKKMALNSRMFDNHFDHRLHKRPWIAPGKKVPKEIFEHDDSGLSISFPKGEKMKWFQEKYDIDDIVSKQFNVFRHFKEYDNLNEMDIVVSIEYCTNCKQHQNSTWHDEKKYALFAHKLKQAILTSFPITKLYLKPLIFNQNDNSIESLYLKKRLGAFEVQICTKQDNKVHMAYLFSKLRTKKWPNISDVVNRLSFYVQKSSLTIQLQISQDDVSQFTDQEIEDQLKGIQVVLTPLRNQREAASYVNYQATDLNDKSLNNTQTGFRQSRPVSGIKRPASAMSNLSTKSYQNLNRQLDKVCVQHNLICSNANLAQLDRTMDSKLGNPRQVFTAFSDKFGAVVFVNLPHDIYELNMPGTNDFIKEILTVNLFEMIGKENKTQSELRMNITLKRQSMAYLNVAIINQTMYLSGALVQVLPLELDENPNPTVLIENNIGAGKYEVVLDPGQYSLTVIKDGFQQDERTIQVKSGTNQLKVVLNPIPFDAQDMQQQLQQSQLEEKVHTYKVKQEDFASESQSFQQKGILRPTSAKVTKVFIYDAQSQEPLKTVKISIKDSSQQKEQLMETDASGECAFQLQNLREGTIFIKKDGYFEIQEEYGGKNNLDLHMMQDLTFPMVKKPTLDGEFHLLLSTVFMQQNFELFVIQPDGQILSSENAQKISNSDIYIENESQFCVIRLKNLHKKQGIYRMYASIPSPDVFHPQNCKVYAVNQKDLQLIEIPVSHNIKNPKIWDIGFVVAPNYSFIELNAATNQQISKDLYLKEYFDLLNFIKNSKVVDLKTFFGFNNTKNKLELNNDIYVAKESILSSLDTYGFETSHQSASLEHVIASSLHVNGLYSFNKLQSKFQNAVAGLGTEGWGVVGQNNIQGGEGARDDQISEGEDEQYMEDEFID